MVMCKETPTLSISRRWCMAVSEFVGSVICLQSFAENLHTINWENDTCVHTISDTVFMSIFSLDFMYTLRITS